MSGGVSYTIPLSNSPIAEYSNKEAVTTVMTHIAIQEQLDRKTVDGMEKVSDEQHED